MIKVDITSWFLKFYIFIEIPLEFPLSSFIIHFSSFIIDLLTFNLINPAVFKILINFCKIKNPSSQQGTKELLRGTTLINNTNIVHSARAHACSSSITRGTRHSLIKNYIDYNLYFSAIKFKGCFYKAHLLDSTNF